MGQSSSSASVSSSAAASPISKDKDLESYCKALQGKKTSPKNIQKACKADKRCSYNKTNQKCEAGESTGEPSRGGKKYTLKKKKHR